MKVRLIVLPVLVAAMLAGCRAGSSPQELEQLRARVSTLEAENAHLQGQVSLTEAERDQLRQQVSQVTADLARAENAAAGGDVVLGEHLLVMPRTVAPGEWVAVYIRNYPTRLLPMAGIALRGADEQNLATLRQLSAANIFLLTIPRGLAPGDYRVVIGEAGELGPGAKLDDQVTITVRGRQ